MINTSMDYKRAVEKNRRFRLQDKIFPKEGEEIDLSMDGVMAYSINEAVSSNGKFEIGAAIAKEYKASLNNMDGRFDGIDFEEADISAKVGLMLEDGRWEDLRKGEFRIVKAKEKDLTIDIEAYDGMIFFDRPYSESELVYPATITQIIWDACTCCQMTFDAGTVQMGDYAVGIRPDDESLTFRDIISYCAQIMGCYAFINNLGHLTFGWYDFETLKTVREDGYDGGVFDENTPYESGDNLDGGRFVPWDTGNTVDGGTFDELGSYHHVYLMGSKSVNISDITITGISITSKNEAANQEEIMIYGEEGYVLDLSDNPLIEGGDAQQVLEHVGTKIVGNTFRPLNVTSQSDPCMEAGDLIAVTDRKQNTYWSVITNTTFSLSGMQKIECGAETPTEKNYTKYSSVTKLKTMAKEQAKRQLSAYEIAARQFSSLMARSMGLYETYEAQEDGSVIKYQHDKPLLSESQTIWKQTLNAFGVSTDGGKTWNAGTDAGGNAIFNILSVIGLNAGWLTAGEIIARKNGKTVFRVNVETGKVDIIADSFSLSSGKTIDDIAQEKADEEINRFVEAVYDPKIANLQSQIDGQIETWYYDHVPTLTNEPASAWKTEADRARHEGDLFYWKSKGYSYRFLKDNSEWKWQIITDSDITKALSDASKAQDTADSKRRVFLNTPTPPYDRGDLWMQGANGEIMTCKVSRSSGNYVSSDWSKENKYIDETAAKTEAKNAIDGQTQEDILNKLTNNGEDDRIDLIDGKLYISFSAMRGDALTLGGSENKLGTLNVLGEDGILRVKASKDSLILFDKTGEEVGRVTCDNVTNLSDSIEHMLFIGLKSFDAWMQFADNGEIYLYGRNILMQNGNVQVWGHSGKGFYVYAPVTSASGRRACLSLDYNGAYNNNNYLLCVDSSSSERYKIIGREMNDEDIEKLYSITPMWAKYKEGYLKEDDERCGVEFPMLIAEDVEQYAPLAADHNEDGQVEDWNYRVMIPYMFQMIKSQKKIIDGLNKRLRILEKQREGGD